MNLKEMVGIEAAKHVENGMIVGLGTGSTVAYLLKEIGRLVNEENLHITGVTTSIETAKLAKTLNIPLKSIDEVERVDLTIDGADEIANDFSGIKGGGAALLFEKIVATYSNKVIWIVDSSKMVEYLGKFPLPVEVIPYGSTQLFNHFSRRGYLPSFRENADGTRLLTDSENHIIDLHLDKIENPKALAKELDELVGVVEHGLFIDIVSCVIVGYEDGPKTIEV
jgi:ribose 5-phosphate isomerase A